MVTRVFNTLICTLLSITDVFPIDISYRISWKQMSALVLPIITRCSAHLKGYPPCLRDMDPILAHHLIIGCFSQLYNHHSIIGVLQLIEQKKILNFPVGFYFLFVCFL